MASHVCRTCCDLQWQMADSRCVEIDVVEALHEISSLVRMNRLVALCKSWLIRLAAALIRDRLVICMLHWRHHGDCRNEQFAGAGTAMLSIAMSRTAMFKSRASDLPRPVCWRRTRSQQGSRLSFELMTELIRYGRNGKAIHGNTLWRL